MNYSNGAPREEELALQDELSELGSAEEFLDFFGIDYDRRCVQVNRLHILQRYHDYLKANPLDASHSARGHYGLWLTRAYEDFVGSSASEQKALKVYRRDEPGFVSLDEFQSAEEG
ncbi:nitrogenase-stabilizing/protective protein NifW [Aestuariirhabdus sp. LZHN29]|uniref:nitrogenase-stabilizing/protective protein NifW n=1 Tax=Aestuariirhabdus sp. LZHN29 TaxID=3417462 RepID=UPI003CF56751